MTESVASDEVDERTVPDLGSAERVLKRDETSAVLRLSEAEAAELAGDPDDQPTGRIGKIGNTGAARGLPTLLEFFLLLVADQALILSVAQDSQVVGVSVGPGVGDVVGTAVGAAVGIFVGAAVGVVVGVFALCRAATTDFNRWPGGLGQREAAAGGLPRRRAGVELRLPSRAPASTTAALATLRLSSVLSPGGSFTIDLPRLPLGFTVVEQLYSEVPNMRYSGFL